MTTSSEPSEFSKPSKPSVSELSLSNQSMSARPGYTLPVFACAAAIAALHHLQQDSNSKDSFPLSSAEIPPLPSPDHVPVDLITPNRIVQIPIEQRARLDEHSALAITRSDPGDNLDLTRNTPVWAWVQWRQPDSTLVPDSDPATRIRIQGGEGIGRYQKGPQKAAIYRYATQLLRRNLERWLPDDRAIDVTIVMPEGKALALRTSNAAFGVVDGLSLLGTSGISEPLSAPGQLEQFRATLRARVHDYPDVKRGIVYCVGENGLDLARRHGVPEPCLIKTANWLGPLLVEAAIQGIQAILLFGHHGKLIKLAGGIFHTHHHLADGRLDILTAQCAVLGVPTSELPILFNSPTTEVALQHLRTLDKKTGSQWVETVYGAIAQRIDQRVQDYIYTHSQQRVTVGTVLFGRDRQVICQSAQGTVLKSNF